MSARHHARATFQAPSCTRHHARTILHAPSCTRHHTLKNSPSSAAAPGKNCIPTIIERTELQITTTTMKVEPIAKGRPRSASANVAMMWVDWVATKPCGPYHGRAPTTATYVKRKATAVRRQVRMHARGIERLGSTTSPPICVIASASSDTSSAASTVSAVSTYKQEVSKCRLVRT